MILAGYKTYIVAGLGIVSALVAHFVAGTMDTTTMVAAIFAGVSAMTIRHGVTTTVNSAIANADKLS